MKGSLGDLSARVAQDPSAKLIVAGNIAAVVAGAFYPPITASLLFVYAAECAIIGVLNLAKMQYVPDRDRTDRIGVAGIFAVHYGLLVLICFGILHAFGKYEMRERGMPQFDFFAHYASLAWAALLPAVTHAVSFYRNFLGKREYETRTLEQQMWRPYRRVVLMIGIMFAAAFLVLITRLPVMAILFFVPFKLWADLRAHFRDHAAPAPATADPRT